MSTVSRLVRRTMKRGLAVIGARDLEPATGITLLIYHRVGGGSPDERDVATSAFRDQVRELERHRVLSLDEAADQLAAGDCTPGVVLTFDDGFADVHANAWPILRAVSMPFTVYVATAYVGKQMAWDGSSARSGGSGLSWSELEEMYATGLVTVGNHTHSHARPEHLSPEQVDQCSQELERHLGATPRHFAYTWGIDVPAAHGLLAERFRTAVTGQVGRNLPDTNPMAWRRVPVRGTDPLPFFRAKLAGSLRSERMYERIVATAKAAGLPA